MPDGHRFRVVCKGAGQRMRGIKWERKRPSMVICDDLEDEELVENEDRRDKFRRWFYGALLPIVKAGGKIRVWGTIMHFDALLNRFMPTPKDPGYRIEGLKTLAEPKNGWVAVKWEGHNDDFSLILWPEQYGAAHFKALQADFARMGMLDVYNQEYRNDPIAKETAFFRRQDLLAMTDEHKQRRLSVYITADLAIAEKKKSAYTSFGAFGVDFEQKLHLIDVRRGRWDALQIVDELFAMAAWVTEGRAHQLDLIVIEEEQIARTLKAILDAEMVKRQIFLPLHYIVPTKDKIARARAFQYRTRAGNFHADKDAEWYPDFEEELARFPKAATRDQVDMCSLMGHVAAEELPALTDEQVSEDEYQREVEEYGDMGRCATTGY